jgi:DNA (cytosine-5)-methyltransferase 1
MHSRRQGPTFISLFSGCGGLDAGFLSAGFRSLGAFDIDPSAVDTYNMNLVRKAEVRDVSSAFNASALQPTVVIAGPPCQGFSTVGARRHSDARNLLLHIPAEVAIATNAEAVLIENVPGALEGENYSYWKTAVLRLRKARFATKTLLVDSSDVGLPQSRRRAILVGIRGRRSLPDWIQGGISPRALHSILPVPEGTANHAPYLLPPDSRAKKIARHIGPGQKLCNVRAGSSSVHTWCIPEVFGEVSNAEREVLETILRLRRQKRLRNWGDADPVGIQALERLAGTSSLRVIESLLRKNYLRARGPATVDLTHTFNGKFRRADPSKPTNCVLTKFCQHSYFLHPYEDRAFTVREAARLQGFPDDFVFCGSAQSQASQVGNAVPPPLAQRVAEWLLELL